MGAENFTSGGECEAIRNASTAKSGQVLEVVPRILANGFFPYRQLCRRYSQRIWWDMLLRFLERNARKWLITSWGPNGSLRPRNWLEFKSQLSSAFAEKDADEWHQVCLIKTRQSGNHEEYITRFAGSSLLVPALDELTKVTLFVQGLSSSELKKEVRREHPKSLSEATRAARTACLHQECNSDPYANETGADGTCRSTCGTLARSSAPFKTGLGIPS